MTALLFPLVFHDFKRVFYRCHQRPELVPRQDDFDSCFVSGFDDDDVSEGDFSLTPNNGYRRRPQRGVRRVLMTSPFLKCVVIKLSAKFKEFSRRLFLNFIAQSYTLTFYHTWMLCMFCIKRSVFANSRHPIRQLRQLWQRQASRNRRLRRRLLLRKRGHGFVATLKTNEQLAMACGWSVFVAIYALNCHIPSAAPLILSPFCDATSRTGVKGGQGLARRLPNHRWHRLAHRPSNLKSEERDWIYCILCTLGK